MRVRLRWLILSAGLAVACNGGDDEASSGEQELGSSAGSDGNASVASTPTERDESAEGIPNERDDDKAGTQSEPDDGPSETDVPSALTDGGVEADDGLAPGEAARIRCEAMDEQTCREEKPSGCIPIQGARYVEQDACIESKFVKCSSSCGDGFLNYYMRDDQGDLWLFPTTCTPDGWQQVAADDPSVSVFDDTDQCGEN